MGVLTALNCPLLAYSSRLPRRRRNSSVKNPRFLALCSPNVETNCEYKPRFVNDLLLNLFRKKMVEEVGWDSEKLGYDGLIEIVNRLMLKGRSNLETEQSAVRILKSLFPPLILVLFKMLVAPIGGGRLASMMVDGSSCSSGVFVERCKYLEESKCIGICINTCKLPTQTFFKDYMGIPLYMEPKFSDYSCQFNFGIPPPPRSSDSALHEPCLEICPNANRRKELNKGLVVQCPKV